MSTSVRVIMEVEVTVGAWNDSADFTSLKEQALREADQIVRNCDKDIKVIGVLRCKFVTFERDL